MRLFPLILALCCIAATSNTCTKEETLSYLGVDQNQAKQVDYAIVLDRSGSMQGEKMETVKQAAKALVENMPASDRAAIISFNYEATLDQSLTNDHGLLDASIDKLDASFSTKYTPPLLIAARELSSSQNNKALIFLTDGASDFSESSQEVLAIAQQLIDQNVCIMTISYALSKDENPLLEDMARLSEERGCGGHFRASEKGSDLESVFSRIHQTISSLEVLTLKTQARQSSYHVEAWSKQNAKPVPGIDSSGCSQAPDIITKIEQNGKPIAEVNGTSGSFELEPGEYSYSTLALLGCSDGCEFSGAAKGNFTVGGACTPTYVDLATYITGETQTVQITKNGFVPQTISGKQGTLIVWKNSDSVPRRVSSPYFDSTIKPGETYTYAIGNVGTLLYSDPDRNLTGSLSALSGAGTDLLLVVDESGSMKGSGIEEAKNAAQKFFGLLSSADRASLITFSSSAFLLQDFTSDTDALLRATSKLRAEGATSYLSALSLADTLRPTQQGVLVFMSDGVPTDPVEESVIIKATKDLRDKGWCTMMVGFGEEGAQAKSLLTRMAGDDECTAFLYAANSRLAQTFGTIYQLSKNNNDLSFTHMNIPLVTFRTKTTVSVQLETKTGKQVPSGSDTYCAPVASVQVNTQGAATDLVYAKGVYTGTLPLKPGLQHISFIAAVSSEDDESRVFTGSTSRHVLVMQPYVLIILIVGLSASIFIWRKRR